MGRLSEAHLESQERGTLPLFEPRQRPEHDTIPDSVKIHFERLAFEVIARGFTRYSSDAILHRIRWFMHIEQGDREFKCNNNWTATLARWFMDRHPQHEGFFETRRSPGSKGLT